jgi:hypothetical protein
VVQFGLRAGPVKRGDPSLRLKSGCAQDDADGRSARSGALRVLLLRLPHSGYKVKVPTLVAKYATRMGTRGVFLFLVSLYPSRSGVFV